jgi:hypothetical protein
LAVAWARSGPNWALLRAAAEAPFSSWRGAAVGGARAATVATAALGALATAWTNLGPSGPDLEHGHGRGNLTPPGAVSQLHHPVRRRPGGLDPSLSLHLPEGQRWLELCSDTAGYLPALSRPPRSLLGALGSPRWWSTCSSSSTSYLLRLLNACLACLRFAGVRCSARVKTLLGFAAADHGDICGCHFQPGGVILGRDAPPLCARGNPRSACRTGQRRHFGVVSFLKVLCWLRGFCWFRRWWPRRL